MIIAAMIAYYVFAIGLIGLVGYLTGRQCIREMEKAADAAMARMQEQLGKTPPVESYVREPLPDDDELPPELQITIRRHPELNEEQLPKVVAEVIREASRLEELYGGDGLEYDPKGSTEEPGRVVLRLVPRSADWGATDRLTAVADTLNNLVQRAAHDATQQQDTGIRAQIARELQPHFPSGLIEQIQVATAP